MKTTATHKGVITGATMIVLSLLFFYRFKLPENGKNQMIVLLIFVAGILWSLLSFKMKSTAGATFRDFFSEGFKTFIVVAFFMAVYTFVFYKLNPQILEESIKVNNGLVYKEGNHTAAEIDENSKRLRDVFMPMMLATKTIMYLLIGSLVSVAGSLILRPALNRK